MSDKILSNFFRPGLKDNVKRFCQACDVCQKTVNRGKASRVPLQITPAIDEPFKRAAIDRIGPIHLPSEAGHRSILTLVDYASSSGVR